MGVAPLTESRLYNSSMEGNLSSKPEIEGDRGRVVGSDLTLVRDGFTGVVVASDDEEASTEGSDDGVATFDTRNRAGLGGGGGL